jgi:hypothetical protein
MLVVVIFADPAPDDVFLGFCMVKDQATFGATAAFTAFNLEWSANVKIDGASRTMFPGHSGNNASRILTITIISSISRFLSC